MAIFPLPPTQLCQHFKGTAKTYLAYTQGAVVWRTLLWKLVMIVYGNLTYPENQKFFQLVYEIDL